MKKIYIVDAVSSHVLRYAISAETKEDAIDAVLAEYVEDFTQRHIGEHVTGAVEVSEDEFIKMFEVENDYLKDLPREGKLEYINVIEDKV